MNRNIYEKEHFVLRFIRSFYSNFARGLGRHFKQTVSKNQMRDVRSSLLWCCLSCLLGEKVIGLANTSLEQIVVLHDELNVVNWKVDKHTSDLGSFLTDQLINEFIEDCTNLVLVVRVLRNDSWENLVSSNDVLLVNGQLLLLNLLLLLDLLLLLLHLDHLLLCRRLLHAHLVLHSHLLM